MSIALSREKVQAQHGMMMVYSFIAIFLTNVVVILLSNILFPTKVVLGTYATPYWWAIHHSMFMLAVINTFAMSFVTLYEYRKKVIFTPKQWMITYLLIDFVAIYGITRFADHLGLGVTSWTVVLGLALVLDFVQGMVMMSIGKLIKM